MSKSHLANPFLLANLVSCVCMCVYLGSKLLLKQVLLKTIEHCLLSLILIFQVFLLFSLCRDPSGKGLSYNFCPSSFDLIFGRHHCVV